MYQENTDILEILKEDHVRLRLLLEDLSNVSDSSPEDREDVFRTLLIKLNRHAAFEDEVLFPGVEKYLDRDTMAIVEKEREEHRQLNYLLERLTETEVHSTAWEMHLARLYTLFDRHAYNEEVLFFPKARKYVPEEVLRELAIYFRTGGKRKVAEAS
jgi:hemerythrin-like domain-containing protein